ncbi:MAG: hypothetical protein RLZZ435_1128, partial [Cyanobacteriota bacterium]
LLGKHNDLDSLFCKTLKHDLFITRCVPFKPDSSTGLGSCWSRNNNGDRATGVGELRKAGRGVDSFPLLETAVTLDSNYFLTYWITICKPFDIFGILKIIRNAGE